MLTLKIGRLNLTQETDGKILPWVGAQRKREVLFGTESTRVSQKVMNSGLSWPYLVEYKPKALI